MPASLLSTAESSLSGFARRMVSVMHPDVKISLANHTEGKIYTTLDAVSGKIEITAPQAVRFDEIRITLEGNIETYVENMSPAAVRCRTTAIHNFLRLSMPVRESDYPQPRIAESGRTYRFPFNFVIPEQLLPRACTHEVVADHVHQAHLQLPPSMGSKELTGKDNLGPEMTKVIYGIRVRVMRWEEEYNEKIPLVENFKKLHVVPAQAEAPPISIQPNDRHFFLSKTKSLRKGVFSGRLGTVTVSSTQTGALMLPQPSEESTTPAPTVATIKLRFDPHNESCRPPKLSGLTTKIKSLTFFSVRPTKDIADRGGTHIDFDPTRGLYETTVNVNSRCMEAVSWTKQSGNLQRKNSASSTSSSDYSDTGLPEPEAKGAFYTATILVPISLPANKCWIPSFQSCIASRVYLLQLSLGVHALGSGVPATSIVLRLPVQIGAAGSGAQRASLTPAEAAAELADAEEFMRPRVIEFPGEELVGNSILSRRPELPPSYEYQSSIRQIVEAGRG